MRKRTPDRIAVCAACNGELRWGCRFKDCGIPLRHHNNAGWVHVTPSNCQTPKAVKP